MPESCAYTFIRMKKRKRPGQNSAKTVNCVLYEQVCPFLIEQGKRSPLVRSRVLRLLLDDPPGALPSIPMHKADDLLSAWRVARLRCVTCEDDDTREAWKAIANDLLKLLEGLGVHKRAIRADDLEATKKVLPSILPAFGYSPDAISRWMSDLEKALLLERSKRYLENRRSRGSPETGEDFPTVLAFQWLSECARSYDEALDEITAQLKERGKKITRDGVRKQIERYTNKSARERGDAQQRARCWTAETMERLSLDEQRGCSVANANIKLSETLMAHPPEERLLSQALFWKAIPLNLVEFTPNGLALGPRLREPGDAPLRDPRSAIQPKAHGARPPQDHGARKNR